MYAYFIDDWTGQRKYLREVDSLDLRLTQNGLSGRKIKMNRLHDLDASVRDLAENGTRTFVAVGNDATASRLLNSLLKLEDAGALKRGKYQLAVLPIGQGQQIARSFNCHSVESAVLALKSHRTAAIDLGFLNQRHYFITAATFYGRAAVGFASYSVSSLREEYEINICNCNIFKKLKNFGDQGFFNTSDGIMEAVISYPALKKSFWSAPAADKESHEVESIFPFQKITIESPAKTIKALADMEKEFSTPVAVEVLPRRLEVVIGSALGN